MPKRRKTEDEFARELKKRLARAREEASSGGPRRPFPMPVAAKALTRAQEETRDTYIKRGQEAWRRHKDEATWTDWLAIGEALLIGKSDAMHAAETNKPIGSRYNVAMGVWLTRYHFDEIDKADRHRLLEVMEHRAEIETWRAGLPDIERLRINHPSTVLRRWKFSKMRRRFRAEPLADTKPWLALDVASSKPREPKAVKPPLRDRVVPARPTTRASDIETARAAHFAAAQHLTKEQRNDEVFRTVDGLGLKVTDFYQRILLEQEGAKPRQPKGKRHPTATP